MRRFVVGLMVLLLATAAQAVGIETVPVGNLGNTGEWAGGAYGGYAPNRICGAVDYAYDIGKYEITATQAQPWRGLERVGHIGFLGSLPTLYQGDSYDPP